MDKKYLQENILSKPYKREVWYSVLKEIFGIKTLNEPVKDINAIVQDPNTIVDKVFELGHFYTADERLVGVYEIQLRNDAKTKLASNKVGLRNLLRSVYKYDVDGALIVFKQGLKWRFSYVSEIRIKDGNKETEPKRYTYLFGEGESCRTAADRFIKLQNKPYYLDDLYDAFSVEKLNEDFFRSYKSFFEVFSAYIANENSYRISLLGSDIELEKGWKDEKAKPIRDFSKKLLGRIVFLQFLQKKGWMGVPINRNNWSGGDIKFLQTLFDKSDKKEAFHSTILKALFFETLNSKRKDDVAPDVLGNNIRIPYLNGGLFDKDISYQVEFDFPIEYFKNLLDFFEQYNFTIDENDPYDSEVGIDPEMLGHIFENLLEENREKGAFYTPKEIVHYMCQESLIEYLHTQLPNFSKKNIDLLVRNNKLADGLTDYKKAQEINDKLCRVKICDPAIGSGAFPMGLLKEIFDCRRLLYGYLKNNDVFNPAEIKKQIIQDNIYGVDKENGAVEIARLRFWLALVVDETVPQPLPNLDYKIMQGDSLLERFRDIDLSSLADMDNDEDLLSSKSGQLEIGVDFSLKKQTLLTFDKESKEFLYDCINDYYNYDEATSDKYKNKQEIKGKINSIVEGKLLAKFNSKKRYIEKQIQEKELQVVGNESKEKDSKGLLAKKSNNISKLSKEIESRQKELNELHDIIDHLHELQTSNYKPYFLWHLWFKDVFDDNGFDIVIGNPPYIQLQKMGEEADILQQSKYKTFTKSSDIYCLFFELGNNLLKPEGNLIYITSNSWLRSNYGKILRTYFTENVNPLKLIDLSDSNVFKSATVRTSIFQFKREVNQKEFKAIRLTRKSQDYINELNSYFENNSITLKCSTERAWVVHEKEKADIIKSVELQGRPLHK
jgi:Eco57I restriction-modification methylase